jgi:hypothetical protein
MEQIKDLADRLPAPSTVDVTIEVFDEEIGDQLKAVRLPGMPSFMTPETKSSSSRSEGEIGESRSFFAIRSASRSAFGWSRKTGAPSPS